MGISKLLFIIFSILVNYVMSSPKVRSDRPKFDPCSKEPAYYCRSETLKQQCDTTGICNRYDLSSPCLQKPEVYCGSEETMILCEKVEFCLTWPNDEVTAVHVTPPIFSGIKSGVFLTYSLNESDTMVSNPIPDNGM